MSDCVFCKIKPLLLDDTPSWIISPETNPIYEKHIYKTLTPFHKIVIKATEFKNRIDFTPKARLSMTLAEASELVTHREIWKQITAEHSVIFTDVTNITDKKLAIKLENLTLPKDWDIIVLTDKPEQMQYVITKRASQILLASSRQFHTCLKTFIESIKGLRIVNCPI